MNKIISFIAAIAFLAGCGVADAASVTLDVIITSPASTSVTCGSGTTITLAGPLAAGANVCNITIAPSTWSGVLALSGTNASDFALNGTALNVGSTALSVGSYSVTITATP